MDVARIIESKGRGVLTTPPSTSVAEVAARLKAARVGAIIVETEDGEVVGIVSERDIVRALVDFAEDLSSQPIAALMTRDVLTCEPSDKVHDIMRQMTESRVRHLPVMEAGTLAGIISIGDIVKHRLEELEEESHQLRDYIASV